MLFPFLYSIYSPPAHAPILFFFFKSRKHGFSYCCSFVRCAVRFLLSPFAELQAPLSSLEITFGSGTTVGKLFGVLIGVVAVLVVLFVVAWGAMQW